MNQGIQLLSILAKKSAPNLEWAMTSLLFLKMNPITMTVSKRCKTSLDLVGYSLAHRSEKLCYQTWKNLWFWKRKRGGDTPCSPCLSREQEKTAQFQWRILQGNRRDHCYDAKQDRLTPSNHWPMKIATPWPRPMALTPWPGHKLREKWLTPGIHWPPSFWA